MNFHETGTWKLDVEFPASGPMTVVDLAQQMYSGIPHHPAHPPFAFVLTKRHGDVVYPGGVSGSAAMIATGDHVGTHVDGFAHVAVNGMLYGGVNVVGKQSLQYGMEVHSVHEMAPIIGTGHLVDLPTLLDRELSPGDGVSGDHLEQWFRDHGPEPEVGSIVLIRTGWDTKWSDPTEFLGVAEGAPGMSLGGARWLSSRGVRATGSDTIAYEHMPNESLDVHVHLLVEKGISIMEAMNLKPLADLGVHRFFFVAAPLSIRGGTGSPIRPLAFVPSAHVTPTWNPRRKQ